jgi:hypothetical protein
LVVKTSSGSTHGSPSVRAARTSMRDIAWVPYRSEGDH